MAAFKHQVGAGMEDAFLQALIEASRNVEELIDVHSVCAAMCERLQLDHFLYGLRFANSLTQPDTVVISGYPEAWRARYKERNYIAVDPTLAHSLTHVSPLFWHELRDEELTEPARAFMAEARSFGLRAGLTLPMHGARGEAGLLSVCLTRDDPDARHYLKTILPQVHLLASYVHEAVCRLAGEHKLAFRPPRLTERERQCLLWACEGKTSWETAQILGITERTVIYHLRKVGEKLGVKNRQQAVAKAVAMGLVTPSFD